MNIRRLLKPMGVRFFLLILAMFQLFQLTALFPDSMYWPTHIIAVLIGLGLWQLMMKIAQVDR